MSDWLQKETTLFERDETGKLLPVETCLDSIDGKPKILVTPLTKGEFKRIQAESKNGQTSKDQDDELILVHCVQPKYSDEEVKRLKPIISGAISTAIIAVSLGKSQEDIQRLTIEQAAKLSDDFQKKN